MRMQRKFNTIQQKAPVDYATKQNKTAFQRQRRPENHVIAPSTEPSLEHQTWSEVQHLPAHCSSPVTMVLLSCCARGCGYGWQLLQLHFDGGETKKKILMHVG